MLSPFGVESHSGLSPFGQKSHSGFSPIWGSVHSDKSPIRGSVVLGSVGESSMAMERGRRVLLFAHFRHLGTNSHPEGGGLAPSRLSLIPHSSHRVISLLPSLHPPHGPFVGGGGVISKQALIDRLYPQTNPQGWARLSKKLG